ncbi:MAG: amidohydrolase family protein [Armatimonadota bacterium]|nr:amidohydrolase family protein [Armatimonadota bacterium]
MIRRGRLRGREGLWDLAVTGGRIAAVAPAIPERGREEIDAAGGLVTPTFVNPHVHLDKTMLGDVMRPNVSQTLQEAIEITWEFKRAYTDDDIVGRAGPVVEAAVAYGTTVLRAFADVDSHAELRAVRGLLALRERYRGIADIQVVAFPQEGIVRDPGTDRLLREAMALGADVVGGLPWYERTDEHMRRHIDIVFEIAQACDADIHMLVDDTDDPNARSLEYLAVKTLETGYRGRVVASHCGALAAYNDTYAAKVVGMVAEAGITICSNPHISLVLAGRRDREPIRRGITRVRELLAAGVNVVSGQDDVNDPYYPFGRNSQAEVALFMAHTAHLTSPDEIERCFDMVTGNAARALRREGYGTQPGDRADLNVWRAASAKEILRWQQPPAYVLKDGRVLTAWSWQAHHRWAVPG